tara:strand:+ start:122 stop:529 length:408 start_codon:yes stop_codon:yes gene_type:complete
MWICFASNPTDGEKNYIDGIFDSWYVIGHLGGFNASNLQAHQEGSELNWFNYDNDEAKNTLPSLMHNVGQLEYQGKWARCWVDLGTADEFSIDVLINSLQQIDKDLVEIESFWVGGINDEWPVDEHPDSFLSINN